MGRAVQYRESGDASVLVLRDVPDTEPGPGAVRVRTRAVGLNPFDAKVRAGFIGPPPSGEWRDVASDFSGVVDAVGSGAQYQDGSAVQVGDAVFGAHDAGALRESFVLPADELARKPAGLSWEVAASLARPAVAARAALDELAIGEDDVVLLSAASGAVGTLYSQMAIQRGATVIGTASPAHHERLRSRGVTAITYGPGLVERVREAAPDGITAVQDCRGGETIDAAFELGLSADRICTIVDYAAKAQRGVRMPMGYQRTQARLEEIAAQIAEGKVGVEIVDPFPLEDARAAFELMESGHPGGNVVVRTDR